MGKSSRDNAIKKFDTSKDAMDRVLQHLGDLREMYPKGYESYYEYLTNLINIQLQVQDFLQEFRNKHM